MGVGAPSMDDVVAVARDGTFVVAWHEEQFPSVKTVIQSVRLPK